MEKNMNTSKNIRLRPGMYIGTRRVIAYELNLRGWQALFYDVIHAFSKDKWDDGIIRISFKDGEFCFVANRQIYLNDRIAIVQALSESFSVKQTRRKTEVRFELNTKYWPLNVYDEDMIEDIIKDYAYLHINQTIVWKDHKYNYPNGLRDMLKNELGIANEDVGVIGGDVEIVIAKRLTCEPTVIDYVNTMRTKGGIHASTLQKAIEKYLPEIAKDNYIAIIDLEVNGSDIMFESINSGKVCYLSDNKISRINQVLKPLTESDEYYQASVDDKNLSALAEMMEENPVLFYDTTELEL